jgi:hypothetical protein
MWPVVACSELAEARYKIMPSIEWAGNIVEENGKTIKENNLELKHTIPLDTLVEIDCDYHACHRMRMYVVDYQRDCDGTPLYGLGEKGQRLYQGEYEFLINASINGGWGENSLRVVE